jgi:hypothetical protein
MDYYSRVRPIAAACASTSLPRSLKEITGTSMSTGRSEVIASKLIYYEIMVAFVDLFVQVLGMFRTVYPRQNPQPP